MSEQTRLAAAAVGYSCFGPDPVRQGTADSLLNFSTFLCTTGFGVCGANLTRALYDLGLYPALFPTGPVEYQQHHAEAVETSYLQSKRFNPDAPSLRLDHQFSLTHHVGRGPRAAWTFFELDRLTPDEVHQINALDVMFASSNWAKGVMEESGVRVPVVVAQPGVDQQVFHPAVQPRWHPELGPPPGKDTTVFLNAGKFSMLKGHDELIEFFDAAFTPADDVLLVMCCFNRLRVPGFDGPEESAKWRSYALSSKMGKAGKVRVLPCWLESQHELAALMAAADCGFFPARAEGWGMESAETLAVGKQVILTDCTAHLDYAEAAGARLVETDGLEGASEHPFIPAGRGNWAKLGPKALASAVEQVRAVHRTRQEKGRTVNQQGVDLFANQITWVDCARTMAASMGILKP